MTARASTQEDYRQRLDRVRAYLESHLSAPVDLAALARVACLSPYHFHRVFRSVLGETVGDYVRRIRLERAAYLLRRSGREVTDVALAVGYESPAAFTRAFEKAFGAPPSVWRCSDSGPVPRPVSLTELAAIHPERVIVRPSVPVNFVRRLGPYEESAPAAWAALMGTMAWRVWLHFPAEMMGICHDDPDVTAQEQRRYDACIHFRIPASPRHGVGRRLLPGGRHAVFLHRGPHRDLAHTYARIYGVWLPGSGEEPGDEPAFEVYLDHPERTPEEKLRTLIHLPLV